MSKLNYNVSKHFKISEFACKDGTPVPPRYIANVFKLAEQLEIIRSYHSQPIAINSGYRTIAYNAKVGGVSRSYHLTASAADFTIKGYSAYQVFKTVQQLMRNGLIISGGLILYNGFVHYDIRENVFFQDKR